MHPNGPPGPALRAGLAHEIKHDGYRLVARLEGRRVRLFSRRGMEWSDRFHRISEALASLRTRSVRIDGEAVVLCPKPGLWLFDQLHSCRRDRDVNLYVFDLLEFNGRVNDRFRLRSARRGSRVSSRPRQGIKLSEHIDALFRHACKPRAHRLQSARLFEI